ncbi:putative membrane protein (plasmid) [Rhizobium favelukesii]|uniref:Membrane protein n=1 Tax=Rhizobium favelukesii TaxID=348824 RepID=W6RPW4_9HYPH|nr:putative membrane protein [Rhizobium favelukesii]
MCDLDVNTTDRAAGRLLRRVATALLPATLFIAVTALPAALLAATCARAEQIEIGSPGHFMGEMQVSPLAPPPITPRRAPDK